jgi:curved DNA-binding protein CbpA
VSTVNPSSVPRVIARDITSLPLGAIEGFVLSRIDGATSLSDIAAVTGQSLADVTAILIKLADLRAIELPGYVKAAPPPPPAASAGQPTAPRAARSISSPSISAVVPKIEIDTSSIPDDHPELADPSDLELRLRREVLALHDALETRDYYALLGVLRTAERKQIKAAYYALAARFHTDRHFGKNLGPFKSKMEQIFGRLTVAADTLTAALRREEYDQYLATHEQTLAYERLLEGYDVDAAPAEERPLREGVVRRVESDPRFAATKGPPSRPPPPTSPSSVRLTAPANAAEQDRLRREALARRLAGSSRRMPAMHPPSASPPPRAASGSDPAVRTPPPPPPSQHPAPSPRSQPPRKLSGFLPKPGDDNFQQARRAHVAKLVELARTAAAMGDHLTAANNYRLALQHIDDPALENEAAEAQQKARGSMVDVYLKQAKFEESDQQWSMAALSYLKALAGRPDDPDLSERAANALRLEGRDLRRAARLAEAAVAKNQRSALYRTTLGHIYLDAGLYLRARAELENAARLAPNDPHVRELLAAARKAAS